MRQSKLFVLLLLLCQQVFGQWNPNTSINLEVSTLPVADLQTAITSTGKTWVAYYHASGGNYTMRAQLLDVDGTKLLGPDGMLVDNQPSGSATFVFSICKDASDNLVIAYQDQRSGSQQAVAYKISQAGTHLWSSTGVILGAGLAPYPAVLSTGETVVAWNESSSNTLKMQKISTTGAAVWTTPITVLVGTATTTRGQIIPNTNGAFTLVFQRRGFGISTTLYAQRYDNNGTAQWTDPVQLSNQTTAAVRYYSGFSEGDVTYYGYYSAQGSRFNSWLQRINADGTLPYGINGSAFSTATGGSDPYQQMTNIASDPQSSVVWSVCSFSNTSQSQYGVFVQKFDKQTGARLLSDNAQQVYPISTSFDTQAGDLSLVSDGPFFMSYDASYKIYATRLDANGNFVWPSNRIELSSTTAGPGTPKGRFAFKGLSNGQAIGVWTENRTGVEKAYAQNAVPGTSSLQGFSFTATQPATATCGTANSLSINLATSGSGGFSGPITLSASGQPAGTSVSFSANPVTAGSSTTITLSGIDQLIAGTYTISVTGAAPGIASQTTNLIYVITPGAAPVIGSAPQSVTICAGSSATFSITANTGSYQWQQRSNASGTWSNITGATSATYALSAIAVSLSGSQYRCIVTSNCGSSTSDVATLTVNASTSITQQPVSQTVCTGSTTTFGVSTTNQNILYQWQVNTGAGFANITNGGPYGGATSNTLTVSNLTVGFSGYQYRCQISGICDNLFNSSAVTLTVHAPATITRSPLQAEVCAGTSASFGIAVSSVPTALYQWQLSTNGGTTWNDIAGATSFSLVLATTTSAMNNNRYRCLVSNTTCTTPVASIPTLLTVRAIPTVGLTAQPLSSLLPGQTTTLTATPSSSTGGSISLQWSFNGQPAANLSGSTVNTTVAGIGSYQIAIAESWTSGLVCSGSSSVVTLSATPSDKLFIYPSPNDGNFMVAYYYGQSGTTSRQINIYDTKGALVYQQRFTISGAYTLLPIEMSTAAAGLYVVVIGDASGKKLASGKVIIN
jgi:hypothetical protein